MADQYHRGRMVRLAAAGLSGLIAAGSAAGPLPLLAEDYAKITVVDIRYVQSAMLGNLVEFKGQDVLFLYSTLVLNNSMGLR